MFRAPLGAASSSRLFGKILKLPSLVTVEEGMSRFETGGIRWLLGVILLSGIGGTGRVVADTPFLDSLFTTVEIPDIQYGTGSVGNPASGEIPLMLDIYRPTGAGLPASLPGLVYIHGGGFTRGSRSGFDALLFCPAFARRGYVTVSISYRLAGDDPTLEPGPSAGLTDVERSINAAAQDAAKAIRWLRANAAAYGIDPDRLAIAGSSAGAITSLFTGYQEAATIGGGAGVSAIVDLWGGMYGGEALVDSDDPPVFIVHGTRDLTVPVSLSEALVSRLNTVGVDYQYYPIEGAGHGPWSDYFNGVVNGKTIDRRCAEFLFRKLDLVEIHPVASASPSVLPDPGEGTVDVSVETDANFLYQLFSSNDLSDWDPVHPDPIAGDGDSLEVPAGPMGTGRFFRWEITPGF